MVPKSRSVNLHNQFRGAEYEFDINISRFDI